MREVWLALILILAATLRLWNLDKLPAGLHWDEMDTGYQAYSLLKTGRDYFGSPAFLSVHSFADYRGPVFIYSAVPFISRLGLTPLSVRLPAVLWSLVGITAFFLIAYRLFHSHLVSLLSSLTLSLSPWHLQYSRQSVETGSAISLFLVGLACFFCGLSRPRWLIPSAVFFALAPAAYAPLRLFTPLFLVSLALIYRRRLALIPRRTRFLSLSLFCLLFIPVFAYGLIGPGSLRARQLSVFTDPTVPSSVNYRREQLQVSSGVPKTVGLSPRLIDKLVHNKLSAWGETIVKNYLRAFSVEYLFLSGDQNLRHSPDSDGSGMLFPAEVIPLLMGLYLLAARRQTLLGAWLVLAPIPASLTNEGNPHAARLLILLPALILAISLGLRALLQKSKPVFLVYCGLWLAAALPVFAYFFGNYRWESAIPFHYGFSEAIRMAVRSAPNYDRVILDFSSDSPLMAYLFTSHYDPADFQAGHPYPQTEFLPGVKAINLGNLFLLPPGHRPWEDIKIPPKTLLVVSASHPSSSKLGSPVSTIFYPDSTPAFHLYTH